MATKIYKSARGRVVDMGALMLENETIRAVGNMNVNARGDLLDTANRVVETKNKQVQKHYQRQISSNTSDQVPTTSTRAAKKQHAQKKAAKEKIANDTATIPAKASKSRREKVVNSEVTPLTKSATKTSPKVMVDGHGDAHEITPQEPEVIEAVTETEVIEAVAEPAPVEPIAEVITTPKAEIPRGGLAAAMAKSQSIKQELLKTQRQLVQGKPGVNKI